MSEIRPRLSGQRRKAFENITRDERRILVIGDIHEPISLDGYLGFCQDVSTRHNCNQIIFIGDCIDSHYRSYQETNPNG